MLARIGTTIANDPGDPLLTAAILHWNAHHVPLTEAWWQFPIFHPTANTLAFSEHLLGISVIATPLAWLTGNPLTTYNLTLLLTFPLSALAMFALVQRLTGSAAAAFVAGLAYGFAPYRVSSLPHIQMLAAFWAPLALLGLHAFLDTGRRRWLALYGAGWLLQVTSNAYTLVLFSVVVGLWVAWFVVAARRWRALAWVAAATVAAAVPLAPIVYQYVAVHAYFGFVRSVEEMRGYSADVAAVLCAPAQSTFWSWLRVACRGEGELFPGLAMAVLFIAALASELRRRAHGRGVIITRRLLLAVAVLFAGIVLSLTLAGAWTLDLGALRISASDIDKPLLIAVTAGVAAVVLSLLAGAAGRPAIRFYLLTAIVTWLLALGPTVTVMGEPSGRPGLFALLQPLPGVSGLRVPARFWSMTVLCLSIAAGLFLARSLRGRDRRMAAGVVAALSLAVVVDGWTGPIPAQPVPPRVPNEAALRGEVVLELPLDPLLDIASTWRAVTGGWRTVNGYSGWAPHHYEPLRLASRLGDDVMFTWFRRDRDLHVILRTSDPSLRAVIERQPGVTVVARESGLTRYRLATRPPPAVRPPGVKVPIARVRADCERDTVALAHDGDDGTLWSCFSFQGPQAVTVDLGAPATVGSVVYVLGRVSSSVPSQLAIETSVDGVTWSEARTSRILGELIEGGLANPRSLRAVLHFPPREARYLRVRPIEQPADFAWLIAEIEVTRP